MVILKTKESALKISYKQICLDEDASIKRILGPNLDSIDRGNYHSVSGNPDRVSGFHEIKYVEINKTTYKQYTSRSQSVQWQLYAPIQINWILTGERKKVYEINKNIVLLYQKQSKIFGFYESFKDNFTRFYK